MNGPIVIGATGGSGTRVVSKILEALGCTSGNNLNFAHDNMDFLFCVTGDIAFLRANHPFQTNHAELSSRLNLFKKLYFGHHLTLQDRKLLLHIGFNYLRGPNLGAVKTRPLHERLDNILKLLRLKRRTALPDNAPWWSFKSPHSILLPKALFSHFPDMRFIHLVRDGRDMALSQQQKGLLYTAELMGLPRKTTLENSFAFWTKTNLAAIEQCQAEREDGRYLVLRFEDMCTTPRTTIDHLADFLNMDASAMPQAYDIPRQISSIGRWKKTKYAFSDFKTDGLEKFGYL